MARRIATGGLCKKQLELPASSLIRTAHGSEAPTRTPTASSATTSPKALISVPLETRSWPTSSANSTSGRARGSAGSLHYKHLVLHLQIEFAFLTLDKSAVWVYT